jgi:hypothetical protein
MVFPSILGNGCSFSLFTQSEESYHEWFTAQAVMEKTVKSLIVDD